MLIFNGGGGVVVVVWWAIGWWWGMLEWDGIFKNVLLHARLGPYTTVQVKHTNLLSSLRNLKLIKTNYIIS